MEMLSADYGTSYTYPAPLHTIAGWVGDWSYGNDTAAHLHVTLPRGRILSVFVEHEEPAEREDPNTARYNVFEWDAANEQPDLGADWFETEDPYALLGYLVVANQEAQ
ncbi:MAG: hypothetical protein JRD89_03535 [Deltaproteobacteria bacterium]|nr:hypothetical protein [Deltaproteobacteria bacterium]